MTNRGRYKRVNRTLMIILVRVGTVASHKKDGTSH